MSIAETRKLPVGWRWAKLGECVELINGRAYSQHELLDSGTPIIRIQNLNGGENWYYSDLNLPDEKYCHDGDLLFAWSATFGPYIWRGSKAIFHYHIWKVITFECLDQTFAHFLLQEITQEIREASHGMAMLHMTKSGMESWMIPLPPLTEQKRIAAILTEKMAAVEKARAAAGARLQAAKELPAAYLREVFESEEALRWSKKRMEEIAELLPSKSIATDGDAEVRAITTACLSEVGFLPTGIKTARMKASDVPQCIVSAREILIARSNTPDLVGRVTMFEGEPHGVVASDLTIRIMPNDWNNAEFLTSYLSFLYLTGYWKDRAGGASGSMKKITRGQILAETVPVPPHEEQERIIMRIRDKSSGVQKLIQRLQDELLATKELPAALLRQAFSDEL